MSFYKKIFIPLFGSFGFLVMYGDCVVILDTINLLNSPNVSDSFKDILLPYVIVGNIAFVFIVAYGFKKVKEKYNEDLDILNQKIYELHDELCKLDENKLNIIKERLDFDKLYNISEKALNNSDILKTAKIMQDVGLEDLLLRFENQDNYINIKYKDDSKKVGRHKKSKNN